METSEGMRGASAAASAECEEIGFGVVSMFSVAIVGSVLMFFSFLFLSICVTTGGLAGFGGDVLSREGGRVDALGGGGRALNATWLCDLARTSPPSESGSSDLSPSLDVPSDCTGILYNTRSSPRLLELPYRHPSDIS